MCVSLVEPPSTRSSFGSSGVDGNNQESDQSMGILCSALVCLCYPEKPISLARALSIVWHGGTIGR